MFHAIKIITQEEAGGTHETANRLQCNQDGITGGLDITNGSCGNSEKFAWPNRHSQARNHKH